jgi:hypothetical protein
MVDKNLSAPAECGRVQPVMQVPAPLLAQYLELMKRPDTKQDDGVGGDTPEHAHPARKTLIGADGTKLQGNFTRDHSDYELTTITNLKTGQVDHLVRGDDGKRDAWQVEQPSLAITFDGKPISKSRESTEWVESGAVATVAAGATFNVKDDSVVEETGSVADRNNSPLGSFKYLFNPDGKATLCARSTTTDASQPLQIDWTAFYK